MFEIIGYGKTFKNGENLKKIPSFNPIEQFKMNMINSSKKKFKRNRINIYILVLLKKLCF